MVPSAGVKDIEIETFLSFMRSQGMHTDEDPQVDVGSDLCNASVCDWLERALRPTLYGLMVFGRDPQRHPQLASLFVQCAAYGELDRASEVLSTAEAEGRLDEQVHRSRG